MRNCWWLSCLFLVSILLLPNRLVTGNDEDDGDLFDVARKASTSADKDLCQNTPGCTCDGKNEQVNCTCIINKQRHLLKQFWIGQMNVPKSVRTIRIAHCSSVVINTTAHLPDMMQLLHISSVDKLTVTSNILKTINHLVIENVPKMETSTGVFDQLKSEKVIFNNVSFPSGLEFQPLDVKQLLIEQCFLNKTTLTVDSNPPNGLIIFRQNILDRVELKISTEDFQMTDNTFVDLSSESAGLMDIEYSKSLNLKNNFFAKMPMPNVQSSNQSLIFSVADYQLSANSRRWLHHFKFIYNGVTDKMLNEDTCQELNQTLMCPNVKIFEKYIDRKVSNPSGLNKQENTPITKDAITSGDNLPACSQFNFLSFLLIGSLTLINLILYSV